MHHKEALKPSRKWGTDHSEVKGGVIQKERRGNSKITRTFFRTKGGVIFCPLVSAYKLVSLCLQTNEFTVTN